MPPKVKEEVIENTPEFKKEAKIETINEPVQKKVEPKKEVKKPVIVRVDSGLFVTGIAMVKSVYRAIINTNSLLM